MTNHLRRLIVINKWPKNHISPDWLRAWPAADWWKLNARRSLHHFPWHSTRHSDIVKACAVVSTLGSPAQTARVCCCLSRSRTRATGWHANAVIVPSSTLTTFRGAAFPRTPWEMRRDRSYTQRRSMLGINLQNYCLRRTTRNCLPLLPSFWCSLCWSQLPAADPHFL